MGKAAHLQIPVHHMYPGLCVSSPNTQLRHPGSSLPYEYFFSQCFHKHYGTGLKGNGKLLKRISKSHQDVFTKSPRDYMQSSPIIRKNSQYETGIECCFQHLYTHNCIPQFLIIPNNQEDSILSFIFYTMVNAAFPI